MAELLTPLEAYTSEHPLQLRRNKGTAGMVYVCRGCIPHMPPEDLELYDIHQLYTNHLTVGYQVLGITCTSCRRNIFRPDLKPF